MGVEFNADEIFEMAEQIERNGARFYRTVAGRTDDPGRRQMLLNLAAWEEEHRETFAAMRAELSQQERLEAAYDPYGEAALYLRAFADGRVFDVNADPSERLTGQESAQEILQTAIGLEKDSIVFYLGMKEMVPEGPGVERVREIIKEEMRHIRVLSEDLAAVQQ